MKINMWIKDEVKCKILFLVLSGCSLVAGFFYSNELFLHPAWIAIILCGIPILKEAITGLVTSFDIKADVLVSLALIAAVLSGEIFAAGEVALIMQIGSLLEELTVAKARAGIERLIRLTPATARVIDHEQEMIIAVDQVKTGDLLRVLPGETIPVDGFISKGHTSINQSIMTGESIPVDKSVGEEVLSGTINQFGTIELKASKVGEDSSIQRMIRLVQEADAGKAKIVHLTDRWATWIVVIALSAAALTWLFTGEVIRAVTILVVFCPCALVLATPTAIMAAIGNATKYGFLVRQGDALERLALVNRVALDKTGTLTYGTPEVTAIKSVDEEYSETELYRLTAIAELYSEHPLGKAIVQSYQIQFQQVVKEPEHFEMIPGKGVLAVIEQHQLIVGNKKLMADCGIDVSAVNEIEGNTVIYIVIDQVFRGMIYLSDTLREDAAKMIDSLTAIPVIPMLITGDIISAAEVIARRVQIDEVYPECLPQHKLDIIEKYQQQGQQICMIGDGVNDAPALKKAMVGIAMGGIGSDIAVDAADIVLVNDDISKLPHLICLSKRMMVTIKRNIVFSMGLNFLAIIFAVTGLINPIAGALVHNAGSVLVIIQSSLLLNWKSDKLNR